MLYNKRGYSRDMIYRVREYSRDAPPSHFSQTGIPPSVPEYSVACTAAASCWRKNINMNGMAFRKIPHTEDTDSINVCR